MVLTNLYLTTEIRDFFIKKSKEQKISMAELIRNVLDEAIKKEKEKESGTA